MWLRIFFLTQWISLSLHAFIPPVTSLVRQIYETRKVTGRGFEITLRHQISGGENSVGIEERMIRDGGKFFFVWKMEGNGESVTGRLARSGYTVGESRSLSSASQVFVKYLLSSYPEELQNQLLAEQFIRQDQLFMFKPNYQPTGDPNQWDTAGNYLRHPDVFFSRLPSAGVAIAVVGSRDGGRSRAVFFDEKLRGLARLEWQDGGRTSAWSFHDFFVSGKDGIFPKRMQFEGPGVGISSEVVAIRSLSDKQLTDIRNQMRRSGNPRLSSQMEASLGLLLSYR